MAEEHDAEEEEKALSPIHEATLDNDLAKVRELLKQQPETVDERGQFVRQLSLLIPHDHLY